MTLACLLVLCMASLTVQRSTPQDDYYVGAVLEYMADSSTDVNLHNYLDFIGQAAEQDADIVVFPEMTLTRGDAVKVPIYGLLKDHPAPALKPELYDNVLVELSRAAREHAVYVLVNVQEELDCTTSQAPGETCPGREVFRFNTNIVFDREGNVIDRYRKINLFGEATRTPALDGQLGVFTTDFGVTFGHFICFDLMFQVPAIQVVQKLNITDVLFSTMWFSEAPFLTAVEIQEAYAYSNNVNFLASGANRVSVGSAGSGIYSGRAGALISTMPGVDTRRLLVSRVPKLPGQVGGLSYPGPIPNDPKVMDALLLKHDQSIPAHVTRPILETEDVQEFTLVDGDVSCTFRIQMKDLNTTGEQPRYHHRALVFDGTNTYAARTVGVSACAVLACLTHDARTCAIRASNANPKYEFTQLRIKFSAYRPKYNNTLNCYDAHYQPLSLRTDKYPLRPSSFKYSSQTVKVNAEKSHKQKYTMKLTEPQKDILTFGIWGRVFGRDVNNRETYDAEAKKQYEQFENELMGIPKLKR